jgi:hypothetical protein
MKTNKLFFVGILMMVMGLSFSAESQPCNVVTPPFSESFDATSLPNCWAMNGPENWIFSTSAGWGATNVDDHTGNGGNFAWVDGSGTGTNTGIGLETPDIDISGLTDPVLTFVLFSNNEDTPGNNDFRVQGWDGSQWNTIYSFSGNNPDWFRVTIDLTTANISDTTKFRFEVDEGDTVAAFSAFYNDILIDDVEVFNNVLSTFSLLSPPDGAFALVDGFQDQFVTATWESSVPTATYEWLASDPSNIDFANPLASFTTGSNEFLDVDFGTLDSILGALMFNVGDTAFISWTVRATLGANTMMAADTFLLLAERGNVVSPITDFDLLNPASGAVIDVVGLDVNTATIDWETAYYIPDSARNMNYTWLADLPGGNFSNPLASIPSGDTALTLTLGQIDNLLASLGIAVGDSVDISWTIRADDGFGNEKLATTPHDLRLKRSGVYALGGGQLPSTTGTSSNSRGPVSNSVYHRSNTIYPSTELSSIPVGTPITHIGFSISTPSTNPVNGTMKLYMRSTTDVTNTDSTTWSGVLANQTIHYNGPLTIPNTSGFYYITLQTPYVYDGNGIYLAWDWEITSATSSPEITYNVNTSVSAGIVRATSSIAPPTSLGGTSSFRPVVFWGFEPEDDDLEVVEVYSLGKVPLENGSPQVVSAIVTNRGKNAVSNADVTLTVSGANTATDVQQVSLANGDTTTVTFASYNLSALGTNTIDVSVSPDDNTNNDSETYTQEVTEDTWAYAEDGYFDGSVGFNTGAGLLLNKYFTNGKTYVGGINITFGNDDASIGQTVYPVILDGNGNILEEGANFVISAADTSNMVSFMLDTPRVFINDSFYVGLAQVAATPGYFPVAFQNETPTRTGAFFSAGLTGSGAADVPFRLLVEAVSTPIFSEYNLLTPADGTTLVVTGQPTATVDITWESANSLEGDVTYTWLLDAPGNDFSNPLLSLPSNNGGVDTALTLTNADIATAVAGLGVGIGDTIQTIWTVVATDDSANTQLAVMPFNLTIVRDTLVSVEEIAIDNFNVYPNPNNGEFALSLNLSEEGAVSIRITDVIGNIVYESEERANSGSYVREINLSNEASGVYFIEVTALDQRTVRRVSIQ